MKVRKPNSFITSRFAPAGAAVAASATNGIPVPMAAPAIGATERYLIKSLRFILFIFLI
jgi:hypothetical protein